MKLIRFLALAVLTCTAALAPATDLSVTAANLVPGPRANIISGIAGATITAGQLLYLDSTAGTYKLADANASAATANVIGIAVSGASAGQRVGVLLEDDDLTVGATLSTAAPVYVASATAGGIAPVADLASGHYPVVVLIAKSTTKAVFKITRGVTPATASAFFDLGGSARLAFVIHHSPFSIGPVRRPASTVRDLVLAA